MNQAGGDAQAPDSSGTYVATAVTARQVFGVRLAQLAMATVFFAAILGSIELFMKGGRRPTDIESFMGAWAYVHDASRIIITYPPLTLWVGLVAFAVSAGSVAVGMTDAIRATRIGNRTGRTRLFSLDRARSDRDAAKVLKRHLREQGRAGLFSGGDVALAIGLLGVGLILATALVAPVSRGESLSLLQLTGQKSLLPTLCIVAGVTAIFGLLLAFPYGPREKVVIDGLGNLRRVGRPELPTALPFQAESTNVHFCHACGSAVSEGGRFCASCGMDLGVFGSPAPGSPAPTAAVLASTAMPDPGVAGSGPDGPLTSSLAIRPETVAAVSEVSAPAPATASAARAPGRRGRAPTIAIWVAGILLLVVGGSGFGLTALEDDANARTLATHLTELRGDLTGSEAKTAALRSRTGRLAAAMQQYAASLEELGSAHTALVDGVNRSWAEFTESGSVAIARNELPPLIDRYQNAVADQEMCQSALAAAVAEQQAATP